MSSKILKEILGVNVAITNMERVVGYITRNAKYHKGQYITLCNVHTTVMAYENDEYMKVQNEAFVALPDGKPLSMIHRLRGFSKAEQVAGPDLMEELWKSTEYTGISHYFYGGSQDTLEKLVAKLRNEYPALKIAGYEAPPFRDLSVEEDQQALRRINASGADIVWVGLGAPKQEWWMYNHRGKVEALMIGVGAGFDFHAGTVSRAPEWMRKCCLEWFYRMLQQPSRLIKRYLVTNPKFIIYLFKYLLR